MPKQTGIIRLKGTLNGICYYKLKTIYLKRRAKGPTKETIINDPAFAAVKANTQEFGGASTFSAAIRTGLQEQAITFKDSYMSSRLSGACCAIIKKGSGRPGERVANLFNAPSELIGFQLHKAQPFGQIYIAKPTISTDSTRTNIQIHIAHSTANHHQQQPQSATHFRLTAAISIVSNYQWSQESNAYGPVNPNHNGLGASVQSMPLVCQTDHQNIHFNIQNPIPTGLPNNVAITVWLGIQYGNTSADQFMAFNTSKAMECVGVL